MSAASPTFELRITITGLALFLPKPKSAPTAMHVYLAKHHMPHDPLVWYDKAHKNASDPLDPSKPRERVKLAGDFDFTKNVSWVGGSVGHLQPPVPCISCATGQDFVPDSNPVNPNYVASHLVLPPGRETVILATTIWNWRGKAPTPEAQHLAAMVEWSVKVNGTQLPAISTLPPLYPKQGVIDLFVSNVLAQHSTNFPLGVGPRPKRGDPMDHFDAYYDLYLSAPPAREYPTYLANVAASTPYSCVSSGGH